MSRFQSILPVPQTFSRSTIFFAFKFPSRYIRVQAPLSSLRVNESRGYGSKHCGHASRCVKCEGSHSAIKCQKTPEALTIFYNSGGIHIVNYFDYPNVVNYLTPIATKPRTKLSIRTITNPPSKNRRIRNKIKYYKKLIIKQKNHQKYIHFSQSYILKAEQSLFKHQ